MSICKSINKVKEVNGMDLLKVVVETDGADTESYWFYDYARAIEFLDKDVYVDYRKDIIDGTMCLVINTFTVPTVVTTLQRDTNIKLFADAVDNFANMSFNDLAVGETYPNALLYCVSQSFESSDRATWVAFVVRDKLMHVTKLRLFDYDSDLQDFTGCYVMTAVTKSKYGLQTDGVYKTNQEEIPTNPEIAIAKKFVTNFFAGNQVMLGCIEKYKLLEHLDEAVDYEKGYAIVRLASELSMSEQLTNVTNAVNVKAIQEALLASYFHYAAPNTVLSHPTCNCLLAKDVQFCDRKLVMQLLDEASDEKPIEYGVYKKIKELVDVLVEAHKGVK